MSKNRNSDEGKKSTKTVYRAARLDQETDSMIAEFAQAEGRSFSNSILRLARLGHKLWKKHHSATKIL